VAGPSLRRSDPVPILLMVATLFGAHWFLSRTRWGTYVYAVGGNAEAARLSGISLAGIQILVYVVGGALAGLAGLVLAARLSSAQPNNRRGFRAGRHCRRGSGRTSLMGARARSGGPPSAPSSSVPEQRLQSDERQPLLPAHRERAVIVLAVLVDQLLKAGVASGVARGNPAAAPVERSQENRFAG